MDLQLIPEFGVSVQESLNIFFHGLLFRHTLQKHPCIPAQNIHQQRILSTVYDIMPLDVYHFARSTIFKREGAGSLFGPFVIYKVSDRFVSSRLTKNALT